MSSEFVLTTWSAFLLDEPVYCGAREGGTNSQDVAERLRVPQYQVRDIESGHVNRFGVVDREKPQQIATWPLSQLVQALALDESDHRPFAGGRDPAKVFIDTESGKQIAALDRVSGMDDLWYDAARKRIYAK